MRKMRFDDDVSRWLAVQARDVRADGSFVYAVKTTKIYCRPVCKARLARRANVSFYASGPEAGRAGFRACKRCKPEVDGRMPAERAVSQILSFVAGHDRHRAVMSLGQMAKRTGLSKWHFHRVFTRTVGTTPRDFLGSSRGGSTAGGQESTSSREAARDRAPAASLTDASAGLRPQKQQQQQQQPLPLSWDDLLDWPSSPE